MDTDRLAHDVELVQAATAVRNGKRVVSLNLTVTGSYSLKPAPEADKTKEEGCEKS